MGRLDRRQDVPDAEDAGVLFSEKRVGRDENQNFMAPRAGRSHSLTDTFSARNSQLLQTKRPAQAADSDTESTSQGVI